MILLGCCMLPVFRAIHYARNVTTILYAVGYTVLTPFSMLIFSPSFTKLACATTGYGCPLIFEEPVQTTIVTGLTISEAGQLASNLDSQTLVSDGLLDQVLRISSGADIRSVRNQQANLNLLSKELQYRTKLDNRMSLGRETQAVSEELGVLGDWLIKLAIDGQRFLDFFITEVTVQIVQLFCIADANLFN